jgi:Na+-translocating ferredoxin:NAD+ oxidoreductase subunit B
MSEQTPELTAKERLQLKIDALLPQTQCGLCGYKGCMPYAEALANNTAPINLCPPGGVSGLRAIGEAVGVDPTSYIADMETKAKPSLLAVIREAECIGCTKCIKACPVDAILGAAKQMHTIITTECTGCELCIAPCPVDCIDMVPIENPVNKADQYRKRYETRQKRLSHHTEQSSKPTLSNTNVTDKKSYIQAALLRAKQKKKS